MSREQADEVALAVDKIEIGYSAVRAKDSGYVNDGSGYRLRINAPLTSTFYKNCIASGSIVPPLGESARVRNSDWWTGICVICIVSLGIVAFAAAALLRW